MNMDFEKALQQIAKSYEDEGYVVIVHPDKDHLPGFALDFGPDLLATRANERVLVQVKQDRADLAADPKIMHRAEITNMQPDWRYDLHVLEQDNSLRKVARVAGQPTAEQIEQMLRDAEALIGALPLSEEIRMKSPELDETVRRSAFLQAWAALEAAMRHALLRDGEPTELQPTVLIRQLYSSGRISLPEYHLIETNRQMRNSIVHGFGPISVHPNQVQSITELARRLLSGTDKPQGASE